MKYDRFIKQCIRNHSKELGHGARVVMEAQKLEQSGKFEKAIKYYDQAKKIFEKAEMMASFIGDKDYEREAKILIHMVEEQKHKAIVTDFYRGGIDN